MWAVPDHSPGISAAQTATVKGVELVSVGTWNASTGVTKVTRGDLEAMVAASRDAGVDRAAIRLGHVDPRFDGEPAMGWVENLRIEPRTPVGPDGNPLPGATPADTLVGDLVGVPATLAAIMPTAYRRRSVEIGWQYRTAAGAQYPAALTGLALLGVTPPAVKGLADVVALYGARTLSVVGHAGAAQSTTTLSIDPDLPPGAAAALELARQQLDSLATSGAVPADQAAAWLDDLADRMRAGTVAVDHHGTAPPNPTGGPRVDEARIRQILGLQAQDDIEAAVQRLVGQQPPAAPTPLPTGLPAGWTPPPAVAPTAPPPGSPPVGAVQVPAPVPGQQPAAVPAAGPAPVQPAPAAPPAAPAAGPVEGFQLPPGMTLVSEQILAELRAGTQAGIAAAQALNEAAVDRELTGALMSGKITPAERDTWRTNMLNPNSAAATRSLLAAMAPRFSTAQTVIGTDALADDAATSAAATGAWEAWESQVFGIPATTPPVAAGQFAAGPPAAPAAPLPQPPLVQGYGYDAIRGYVPLALPPVPRGA